MKEVKGMQINAVNKQQEIRETINCKAGKERPDNINVDPHYVTAMWIHIM